MQGIGPEKMEVKFQNIQKFRNFMNYFSQVRIR